MLAVHTSNNSSRQASPGMPPSTWQHQKQNYREPRAFRAAEQDAAVSSALVQGKLAGSRPSPDVFQNGNSSRMTQLDAKQTAFSIDSDDLLTPQRESLSSETSMSSSPQESVPDPSGSSTSSSPPHQSQYRHPDYPQRSSVASPTFSTDSHRSSLRASPSAQHQQLPDEFGRASYPFEHSTVRPGDRQAQNHQGLSPLSPFTEPFSPPGSESRSPQPGMLYAAPRSGELGERRSVSSLSSANAQSTASSIDVYPSAYGDYRPPSTSSSVATPAASNQQAKSYTAMTLNGEGSTSNPLGFSNTAPASTLAQLPLNNTGSDHFGPSSRSSQDSSTAASTTHPPSTAGAPEEISTIFVVGFPDDMHEREFQNMFIFSPGFEAAILKTPHAGSTASNASNSSRDGALAGASKLPVAGGLNYGVNSDQYNVSMMHGHGIFDNQVDDTAGGSTLSHALSQRDGPRDLSQRKQIIGFAKFRSRQEAMDARDVLSGRRVDAEKDCVLKAEMAKKNLHTRRGLANEAPAGATSSVGVGNTAGNSSLPSSVLALGQQNLAIAASLNPAILANIAQRSPSVQTAAAAAHAAASGPASSDSAPGPVLREVEPLPVGRDRSLSAAPQQRSAFDAFHSVPASQVSPSYSSRSSDLSGPPIESRFNFGANGQRDAREAGSPSSSAPLRQAPTAQAPYSRFGDAGFGKSLLQQLDGGEDHFPAISQGSDSYGRQAFFNGRSEELSPRSQLSSGHVSPPPASYGSSPPSSSGNYASRFQGLSLNTGLSNTVRATSPPSAGMLSPRGGNPADMNPPINTLYVGGLPAVLPSLTGPMSASHLEDSLRAVFSRSPGFKRLCFRQKSNGPMSFVEFDNVEFATRAMQDLYGHTLGGLVKGGIRLSFSKNPLGVRSNSVSSNPLSTPLSPNFGDAFLGGPNAAASTPTPQTSRRLGVDSGYMSPHNASAYGRSMGSRGPTSPGFTPFPPSGYDSNAPF